MKISQIEFLDWRCFPGNQKIFFSTDRNKPLTTIWGTNGSGKTTILNAILWAMWNELSPDFQEKTKLVNDIKMAGTPIGATAESFVEIRFEHKKSKFTLKRTHSQRKDSDSNSEKVSDSIKLVEINEMGESFIREGNVAFSYIDQILPKTLAKYFFFNGENFPAAIGESKGRDDFGKSVQRVLGLTKYDRAIKHCDDGLRKLLGDVGQLEDDAAFNELIDGKKKQELELEISVAGEVEINNEIKKCRERITEIDDLLQKFDHISDKITRRKEIGERLIPALEKSLSAKNDELRVVASKNYSLLVLKEYTDEISELSERHREQKHIPAGFKQTFIADLLSSGLCICGCQLVEGQPNYQQVSARLQEGAVSGTEEEWTILGIGIDRVKPQLDQFTRSFRELTSAIHTLKQGIDDLSEESESLTREIQETDGSKNIVDQIQSLEKERQDLKSKIEEFMKEVGKYGERIVKAKEAIKVSDREIAAVTPKKDAAKLARKHREYLQAARDQLATELIDLRIEKRSKLQEQTTYIFRSLSNLNYFVELDDDFVIRVCDYDDKAVSREVAMGNGDTLMTYYAFVSALSKMSMDSGGDDESGQTFPLMIDAPISVLDDAQKLRVAYMLPEFTHQLGFFMVKTHVSTFSSADMEEKIGRNIVFQLNRSMNKPGTEEEVKIGERIVPYTLNGSETLHFTKIVQVL